MIWRPAPAPACRIGICLVRRCAAARTERLRHEAESRKVEPSPNAAIDRHIAAHQAGELARDRKAKPCAAEAARDRGVGLREGAEQALDFVSSSMPMPVSGDSDMRTLVAAVRQRLGADAGSRRRHAR
jgi:hypothetical protein